ncbi:MBL fold metallo-hydrolase [Lonepinella sp. MS14437]|uniref:MBL fold metallo-hydrolase n=1 Tax=Lonepinella sp. MS14437 TaxID=3003620 RepID=UPI0036DF6ABB
MRKLFQCFKKIVALLVGLLLSAVACTNLHPTFGGSPDEQSKAKINKSPNFNGKTFVNLEPTPIGFQKTVDGEDTSWLKRIFEIAFPPAGKQPSEPLPSLKLDISQIENGSFTWLGHSTVLFKLNDKILITDPVFHRASPIFFGGKPFAMTHTPSVADLPTIDAVIISHDHYDHLDYQAIQELNQKTTHFYVPLGVKGHLQRWGVPDEKITELDWYEQVQLDQLHFTLTPSRHFSGRGLTNRNTTLWGSWVIKSPLLTVFFNGDGGYGQHYKLLGEKYGPFDIALMENGAYDAHWSLIHMTPEQSVQATVDLKAKAVLPIHWAKFDLANHNWRDPIQRFLKAAEKQDFQTVTPKIGQTFTLNKLPQEDWWSGVK